MSEVDSSLVIELNRVVEVIDIFEWHRFLLVVVLILEDNEFVSNIDFHQEFSVEVKDIVGANDLTLVAVVSIEVKVSCARGFNETNTSPSFHDTEGEFELGNFALFEACAEEIVVTSAI